MHPDARLRMLRENRAKPIPDGSIAEAVARAQVKYQRLARDGDGIAAAWDRTVPERFRGRAAVVGHASGILTIRCRSASDRFGLDRWLRGGGEQAVREAARVTLKRVKLVLR